MNPQEYKEALVAYEKYKQSGAELTHWGISGMKWGRRRWQNEDGSLTEEGRIHYGVSKKVKTVGEAREQAKANARATRVATKQAEHDAKFQAKLENQKKIAEAKADAIRIKAETDNEVKVAAKQASADKFSSWQEGRSRNKALSNERLEEKNRHKENNIGRKLLLGGAAVAGAAFLISKWKGTNVSDAVAKVTDGSKEGVTNTISKVFGSDSKSVLSLPMKDIPTYSGDVVGVGKSFIKTAANAASKASGVVDSTARVVDTPYAISTVTGAAKRLIEAKHSESEEKVYYGIRFIRIPRTKEG